MATVKFISDRKMQTRAGLSFILRYCQKEKKTQHGDRQLVTGINCLPASAYREFVSTKLFYRKDSGRMFYHLLQSFHPDEAITPETAHEIAVKFASVRRLKQVITKKPKALRKRGQLIQRTP